MDADWYWRIFFVGCRQPCSALSKLWSFFGCMNFCFLEWMGMCWQACNVACVNAMGELIAVASPRITYFMSLQLSNSSVERRNGLAQCIPYGQSHVKTTQSTLESMSLSLVCNIWEFNRTKHMLRNDGISESPIHLAIGIVRWPGSRVLWPILLGE
jgi:hypothetical protein